MTPEQTLDWLAQQHFDQCFEERPIQDWIRKMKSQLPEQPEHDINSAVTVVYVYRQADGNTQVVAPDTNNEELVTDILYEALQAMTTGHQLEKH